MKRKLFPILLSCASTMAFITSSNAQIVPPGWIAPESLENAEEPIQKHLDTGVAMIETALDMAAVKDSRLLVI